MKKTYLFLATTLLLFYNAFSQASFLDNSFGTNGLVTVPAPPNLYFHDVVIRDDGKIICAVRDLDNFRVHRFNSDGSIDAQFGNVGVVMQTTEQNLKNCVSLAIQPDGKILALCLKDGRMAITRLDDNGDWDNSFGDHGVATENTGMFDGSEGSKILLKPDGKIVIVGIGIITDPSPYKYLLVALQYDSDGTPDESFGDHGYVTEYYHDQLVSPQVYAVLQKDGKVVVGYNNSRIGASSSLILTRYNSDGTKDISFGTAGTVVKEQYGMYGLVLQSDDRIVYRGAAGTLETTRLNTNGSVDNTYGINGVSSDIPFTNYSFMPDGMLVQRNNKILMCNQINNGTISATGDGIVTQFDENGFLVHAFASNGSVYTDFNGLTDDFICMAIQKDDKIVAAGMSFSQTGNYYYYCIARYNSSLLGVNELQKTREVKIYPNPNSGNVVIEATKVEVLYVFNISGQILRAVELNSANGYTATIAGLPQGTSIVRNRDGAVIDKIVTLAQ